MQYQILHETNMYDICKMNVCIYISNISITYEYIMNIFMINFVVHETISEHKTFQFIIVIMKLYIMILLTKFKSVSKITKYMMCVIYIIIEIS